MLINGRTLLLTAPIKDMKPNKVIPEGAIASHGLSEIGYDIRIKQEIQFFPKGGIFPNVCVVRDPVTGKAEQFEGRFCLASSVEEFQMPTHLGAVGHDKSTFARLGVQVFNTVIEPGWKGFLTIELVFNGEKPVHIPAGTGIMQIIFHELTETASYDGKYQDQPNEPVPAKHNQA